MRKIFVIAAVSLACLAGQANAEIFGTIKTADETIILSDKRGPCPIDFNLGFKLISKDGKPYGQGGCYRIEQDRFVDMRLFIDGVNAPVRRYSLDDFVLSDFYRRMNPLSN